MVLLPKKEGDLGVLVLRKQNEALLMKNLDKFLNRRDIYTLGNNGVGEALPKWKVPMQRHLKAS